MSIIEIIILSIALAMDAFAVSMCKGLAIKKLCIKNMFIIGLYFGIFQGVMPLIGYFLGINFQEKISKIDHWIAFVLLLGIGFNMIKEVFSKKEDEKSDDKMDFSTMLILSIATSIDALAVGITFACLKTNVFISSVIIGVITFVISVIGVKIGNIFGRKYEKNAQFFGGIILVLIGIKILLEHLIGG